jgi:multisubunit Na+/H+ antiporter MnhG subunit
MIGVMMMALCGMRVIHRLRRVFATMMERSLAVVLSRKLVVLGSLFVMIGEFLRILHAILQLSLLRSPIVAPG